VKELGNPDKEKLSAAMGAVELVRDGMVIGLGSGTTVYHLIVELGRRVSDGLDVAGVPTSFDTARIAREHGVPITDLESNPQLDLALDGADQIRRSDLCCIKGGGGAHLREKIVAQSAREFVVLVDSLKVLDTLSYPVPLEVLPFGWGAVCTQIEEMGASVALRDGYGKLGPIISDNGNLLADADFGEMEQPLAISARLDVIPGLLEHGIFRQAHRAFVGHGDRFEELKPGK